MSAALSVIAGAGFPAAVVTLGATPCAATIFPKHPHVEGGIAVKLEVQGAPPAQARVRANICQPRAKAMFPTMEISTETQEALLQQPSACSQSPPGPEAGSSSTKKRGS